MMTSDWRRVSHAEPCPICGKPDNCTVSTSGEVVWCGRISEGSQKENEGGQFLHIMGETSNAWEYTHPAYQQKGEVEPKPKPKSLNFGGIVASSFQCAEINRQSMIAQKRRLLSSLLGVSVESLFRLQVGWQFAKNCWTFPEKDTRGKIIGIVQRFLSGSKKSWPGGKRGLTFARDWDSGEGPIFVAEGGSCVAAGMDLGLNIIGRPSNSGGTSLLAELFGGLPTDRDIIILGKRDQKPNGKFPGRDGAIAVAKHLAEKLERPIGWSFPPGKAKDVRHWLNGGGEA